jgi:hypothetical protein
LAEEHFKKKEYVEAKALYELVSQRDETKKATCQIEMDKCEAQIK